MKIAIIGAGYMAGLIAERAAALGVETICFSWDKDLAFASRVDRFYPISITLREEILAVCKKEAVDGVVPTTELTVPVAAYVADGLGLPGLDPAVAARITDKAYVRSRCTAAKTFRQPAFTLLHGPGGPADPPARFPVIVKPVSEGGKRGVEVVSDPAAWEPALSRAFAADKKGGGVLAEEFVGGKEYSVEALSFHGAHRIVQITEKISSGPPNCVELGHSQPAALSSALRGRVIAAVRELLTLTGCRHGASHTELKIDGDEIYLIELNARPGGDHIAHPLTYLSTGCDYLGELVRISMGLPPSDDADCPQKQCAGVRFVTTQTAFLKPLFDSCDGEPWLYEKHVETQTLQPLEHNDCSHTNYIIYCAHQKPPFPGEE